MTTTTNLADFGYREIEMARDLLSAWVDSGLPRDFAERGVTVMMNQNSGNVFLTNEEYEVAMVVDGKLESFYTSPYDGKEGFFSELLEEYADMNEEDKEWFKDVAKNIGKEDQLPKGEA